MTKKLNSRIEQVERLKKQVSAMSKALVNVVSESDEVKGQLTKAKELLTKWVELYKPKLEGYPIPPIQEQTEQFLKEK